MITSYKDHTDEVLSALDEAITKGLTAIGGTAEAHAKKSAPVDTGRLRNSITFALAGGEAHVKQYRAKEAGELIPYDKTARSIIYGI